MNRVGIIACLVAALAFVPAARAADAGGASFTYNSGNGAIGLRAKNNSDSALLTKVDFTLPVGTEISNIGSTGCTKLTAQDGSCTLSTPRPPGQSTFILINTTGAKPDSIYVTLNFDDGGSVSVNATECATIDVSPESLANGTGNSAYSQQFAGTGGVSPFTFSLQGVLPADITLSSSGLLSGTPGVAGEFSFTVLGSDANACSGSRGYTLTIEPEPAGTPQFASADVQALSVLPGVFFEEEEDLEDLVALTLVAKSAGLLLVIPEPADPGFKGSVSDVYERDFTVFGVIITNNGPQAASFTVEVIPSRPLLQEPNYLGYEGEIQPGSSEGGYVTRLIEEPPPTLEPGKSVTLLYHARVASAGPITVDAHITSVIPSDPNLLNNSTQTTFTIKERSSTNKVSFAPSNTGGGDLKGKGSAAAAARTGMAAAAVAGAAAGKPIEIAVLRKKGETCAWLTGASGKLQKEFSAPNCQTAVFLRAKGTISAWRYHLRKRPPRGAYSVLVREALGEESAHQFSTEQQNLFTVRIR